MNLSTSELSALRCCAPTLKRTPSGFIPAPRGGGAHFSNALVRRLAMAGLFAYGNKSESYVTLTTQGRAAIGVSP